MADIQIIQNNYMNKHGNKQQYLWKYYTGDKSIIPVYSRKVVSNIKADTMTYAHIDFFGDIIDLKQGYMGQKIEVVYRGKDEDTATKLLELSHDTLSTDNSQTIEYSSVEGLSHRLVYTEDGQFKSKNLHGWQVVYEYDQDIFNPERAYYFFAIQGIDDIEPTNYCNIYDREKVYYYHLEKKTGPKTAQDNRKDVYIFDRDMPHNFNQVPIIPFMNNSNWESNCDKTTSLMDVYDEIISDTSGELKAARLAYLKIFGELYTGVDADGQAIPITDYLKQFGVMMFGQTEDGKPLGDASFLEKKLDDVAIENMLNRLKTHIYDGSSSIDLKELSSAERVFSIKAAMCRLENNAKISENYFKLGMRKFIDLWLYYLENYYNIKANPMDFNILVGRVFPFDEEAASRIFNSYVGILALEDAFRLSGIESDDIPAIIERAQEKEAIYFNTERVSDDRNIQNN